MNIGLTTENYAKQTKIWPSDGKHILAQYTDEYVVVYQAYNKRIGEFAIENQYFGGDFSFSRMSWVKTNFLWMMYRSGWGTKPNQEVSLALYLKRDYFQEILKAAFPSSNILGLSDDVWREKTSGSDVRLQWDPDHDPYGAKLERKAIQLGLRNKYLLPFRGEGILKIEDISKFVGHQRNLVNENKLDELVTPKEEVFPVSEELKETLCMR